MDDHRTPTRYEIHVRGLLSERLIGAFPEFQARTGHHETVLTGALPDQSALHGVLGRIEAYGLELLEVRRRPRGTDNDNRAEPVASDSVELPVAPGPPAATPASPARDRSAPRPTAGR